jgi:hypothetical protein
MELLKKHYEKILLGVVLLGLTVGAALLPLMISGERAGLDDQSAKIINRQAEPLPPLNLAAEQTTLDRTETQVKLDLSTTNKLFNPLPWQKAADGHLIKVRPGNIGPDAVVITNTPTPLYTIISLDSVQTNETEISYVIDVERQASAVASQRRKKPYFATLNNKNDIFVIRQISGPPDNPTGVTIELNDTGDQVVLAPDKPFKRVDGYMADLRYDPEKKSWVNVRVGSVISFGGETYNIVAISKDEVVLSAKSNNKKTPIQYNPAP